MASCLIWRSSCIWDCDPGLFDLNKVACLAWIKLVRRVHVSRDYSPKMLQLVWKCRDGFTMRILCLFRHTISTNNAPVSVRCQMNFATNPATAWVGNEGVSFCSESIACGFMASMHVNGNRRCNRSTEHLYISRKKGILCLPWKRSKHEKGMLCPVFCTAPEI
jgi:hypothetical protein